MLSVHSICIGEAHGATAKSLGSPADKYWSDQLLSI